MRMRYSKSILRGLEKAGIKQDRLHHAGISENRLMRVLAGNSEFTDREIGIIERLTGRTGGQLAAQITEPAGGELTSLMDAWARVAKLSAGSGQTSTTDADSIKLKSKSRPIPAGPTAGRLAVKSKKRRPILASH